MKQRRLRGVYTGSAGKRHVGLHDRPTVWNGTKHGISCCDWRQLHSIVQLIDGLFTEGESYEAVTLRYFLSCQHTGPLPQPELQLFYRCLSGPLVHAAHAGLTAVIFRSQRASLDAAVAFAIPSVCHHRRRKGSVVGGAPWRVRSTSL